MGKWICGKCQSQSTYYQDGALACMMCGNRTPSRWGFQSTDGRAEIKPLDPGIPEPDEYEDEQIEQEKEIDMGKKRTPEQRERIAAGIRAARAKKKASESAEKVADKISTSTVVVNKLPDPLPIVKIEGEDATLLSPDPRIATLDFTRPENEYLYEPLVTWALRNRRSLGDQAMIAVEQILTDKGLL